MVAETPTEGRCNANVVDKIGLEVECEVDPDSDDPYEFTLDDLEFDSVRLVDSNGTTVHAEASYEHCRKFLWDGYDVVYISVEEDEADDTGRLRHIVGDVDDIEVIADQDMSAPDVTKGSLPEGELVWFDIGTIVTRVTNRDTDHQGFCERYKMNEKNNCYVHQGGGPAEGNTNAMKHGLYAQRTNFYNALGEEDQQFIEAMVDSWIDQAPFNRNNPAMVNTLYRCAIDQLKAWFAIDEYVDENGSIEGITKVQDVFVDGEVKEIEDENPINMPYSRLTGDVRQELKDLGVYSDPESKKAEATESLARKLSGLTDE